MKNKLCILFILATMSVSAQFGKLYVEANYNSFGHTKLSEFQQQLAADFNPIPIQVSDDFPAHIGLTLGYEFTESNIAVFASYNVTGGKLSYADFSGVVRVQQNLQGITLGSQYLFNFNEVDNLQFGLRLLTTFSNLSLDSYSEIGSTTTVSDVSFNAIDFGGGLQFIYEYPLSFLNIRASFGYDFVFGGPLKFKDNTDINLVDNSGQDITTGWSGIRFGLGVSIPIN